MSQTTRQPFNQEFMNRQAINQELMNRQLKLSERFQAIMLSMCLPISGYPMLMDISLATVNKLFYCNKVISIKNLFKIEKWIIEKEKQLIA